MATHDVVEKGMASPAVHHADLLSEGVSIPSSEEADEAFMFLQNHPDADKVAQEGSNIVQDPKALRKLLWKVDMRIMPLLAAVYFLQFLDKTTLNYTSIMGLREDTHLKGQEYSTCAFMFYVGLLAAEFPTQFIAQRSARLGVYLGVNVMLWGLVLGCHAACTSYAGLVVVRLLLGVFEAW